MVKNPPAMQETWVRSLDWEDPLEEGMTIHSSILAWRIPMDRGAWWAACLGFKELEVTTHTPASLSIISPRKPTWPVPTGWEPQPWVSQAPLT